MSEPIAIVGMGCRFPGGVSSPQAFWRFLESGGDAIGEVPPSRWDIDAHYDPNQGAPGKMYVRTGAFLDQPTVEQFDAPFFHMTAREAASLDPQQRLLLEVSWEALENAGVAPLSLQGSRAGVFVAVIWDDYSAQRFYTVDPQQIDRYATLSALRAMAAGRIAHILGCHGPVMQVDTACSSSLL
ncbi:MAG: polyketide synthase, partial [Chloroflexales bacterium]|nr:polyketide synthase [Chloroflexales bacterium]